MKVAVSILNSTNIKRDLELLNNTSCDYLHIDVMDNKFVTNQNDPYDNLKYYENLYNKRLDVHLMCEKPIPYINKYINVSPCSETSMEKLKCSIIFHDILKICVD